MGALTVGSGVNLERALRLSDRLGGHIVSGHVDAVSTVISREKLGDFTIFTFSIPDGLAKYIITKGSTGIESFLLSPKKTEPIGGGSYASLPPEKDSGSSTCGRDQREGGRLEVGAATVPTLGRQPRWAALLESASGGRWRAGRRDCDISKILF